MSNLESWVRYGDEMRRPLLISGNFAKSSKIVIVGGGAGGGGGNSMALALAGARFWAILAAHLAIHASRKR